MASKSKATSLNPDDVLAEILRRRPQFKQASDALVFALMTSMRLQGFQVVALDERSDAARTGERDLGPVPRGWNKASDVYTLVFVESGGDKRRLVFKAIPMDTLVLVHVTPLGGGDGDDVLSAELCLADYVDAQADLTRVSAAYRELPGLVLAFESAVLSKLVPQEEADAAAPAAGVTDDDPLRVRRPQRRPELDDPLRDPRFQPRQPPIRPPGYRGDFDDDLHPALPGFGGPGGGGGGGLAGPNHPMFRGGGRGRGGRGARGPRYDPMGPFGGPMSPDNDHLPPPGRPGPGSGRGSGGRGFPEFPDDMYG